MPKSEYNRRLSQQEVIRLLHNPKRYLVDPDIGSIASARTRRPLYEFTNKQSPSKWVRLYESQAHRAIAVSWCIWLFMTKVPIPFGFEIHHRNTDVEDNRWLNLFCLFRMDHSKLHNGDDLIVTTPF